MENEEVKQADFEAAGDKVWAAGYLGPNGAMALSRKNYENSFGKISDEDRSSAAMEYACVLFSFFGYCVAQVKQRHPSYMIFGAISFFSLNLVVSRILYEMMYIDFNASQKEALMAHLLLCRFFFAFVDYRKMAIKMGEDVLDDAEASISTSYLVRARLYRLWFHRDRKINKELVRVAIYDSTYQKEFGWRTVSRLARMIGDDGMAKYSAHLADSQDVIIKSGL